MRRYEVVSSSMNEDRHCPFPFAFAADALCLVKTKVKGKECPSDRSVLACTKEIIDARCDTSFLIVSAWSYRPGKGVKSHHWKEGMGEEEGVMAIDALDDFAKRNTYTLHCESTHS